MPLWNPTTSDRLRCFSKHALPNKPGWQLAFSGRAEQRSNSRLSNALADQGFKRATPDTSSLPAGSTEAAFTVHMLFPLLAKQSRRNACSRPTLQQTEHLDQTDPLYSLVAVFEFKRTTGKERLRFGECLGNTLGAAGSVQWTASMVCTSDTARLRLRSGQLSGGMFAEYSAGKAGYTSLTLWWHKKKEPGAYRLHALWTFCRQGCAKYAQNSCPKLCTLPVLPFGKHAPWACRHCFSHPNMPGWPLPCFGRSEQRSATRLRTALADQNDGLLPIHMPFSTHALQAPLSPRHRSLSTYHHCNHYNMTTTACLLNIPSARIRAVSSKQLPKARHPAGATVW